MKESEKCKPCAGEGGSFQVINNVERWVRCEPCQGYGIKPEMKYISSEIWGARYGGTPQRLQISHNSPPEIAWPHRYSLWKRFRVNAPLSKMLAIIGHSPSPFDFADDTISRYERYAKDWGYRGFVVLSLFSDRGTGYVNTLQSGDPENLEAIREITSACKDVLCCWGDLVPFEERPAEVLDAIGACELLTLGFHRSGSPIHAQHATAQAEPQVWVPKLPTV